MCPSMTSQSIQGAPACGDVMQNVGTLCLLVERSLDGVHLASDAAYAIEQFLFFFCGVSHKKNFVSGLYRDTRQGIP